MSTLDILNACVCLCLHIGIYIHQYVEYSCTVSCVVTCSNCDISLTCVDVRHIPTYSLPALGRISFCTEGILGTQRFAP